MGDEPQARDDGQELDLELVRRVQAGDRAAFDLLVRKYQHRIAAVIHRFVPDHAQCEDLTQDSFIRAYRALSGFRGEAQFHTWLHRIAVNTAKNHLVAVKRRPPSADLDAQEAEHHASGGRMQDHDTPEHQLLRQELAEAVSRTVASLPDDLRTAITLREVDGLSYEQISERMGCPVGTVRSRIFRARDAIDRAMGPLLGHPTHES
jgi:RNA polymerase sigma-70 factor (ECF subfamily)